MIGVKVVGLKLNILEDLLVLNYSIRTDISIVNESYRKLSLNQTKKALPFITNFLRPILSSIIWTCASLTFFTQQH